MLKLHHVDATSRHVDFMSISNSDVLEEVAIPVGCLLKYGT